MGNKHQQVDALLSCAEQPTTSATPTPPPTTRPTSDDAGDHMDVAHLVDGLRSDTPPPMVSNPRGQVGNNGNSGATLERNSGVPPGAERNRDHEPTAPAPFHSHVWGSKATAGAPYEDGEEGKLARAGAAASADNSDRLSGPDVAA